MADVTIIPPQQVLSTAPTGGNNAPTVQSTVPTAGSLVSGTIAGRDTNGNYLLRTQQGTFSLHSETPLTYNSDVTIRIGTDSSNARIISVNGEPFSEFSAPQTEDADSLSPSLLTSTAAATAETSTTPTATLPATVVAAPSATPQQPANPLLAPGNTVNVRFAQTQQAVPEPDTSNQNENNPGASQSGAQAAPPAPSPAAATGVSLAVSAEAATTPQEIAQNPQIPAQQVGAAPAPAPAPQAVPSSASPSVATVAQVETDLPAAQAVTQVAQPQDAGSGSSGQPQTAATASQPASAPAAAQQAAVPAAPSPPATVSAGYNVYARQAQAPPAQQAPATPAAAGTSAPQNTPTSSPVPAQVVSAAEDGTVVLQTPAGNVTLNVPASPASAALTPGTSVMLEALATAPAQAALTSAAPAMLSELAASWQSLKDILNTVEDNDPEASTALLARMPQMGPDFVAESISFMAAALQGDTAKLLGEDTVDNLHQSGRGDLVEKFSAEVAELAGAFTPTVGKQGPAWQTFFLPFVYQESLEQARIYVKRDPPRKDKASPKATDDTRFVVEVDLSDIGPLQMDGLVRKQPKSTAFDLVIRSHQPFPQDDKNEMFAIYNGAAELTGFKGTLSFQVTHDFPVKPLKQAAGGEDHGITV